jgi:hypothetical protein
LACLLVPFAPLVFLFRHWDEGGKPFLVSLGGAAGGGLALYLAFVTVLVPQRARSGASPLPPGVIQEDTVEVSSPALPAGSTAADQPLTEAPK